MTALVISLFALIVAFCAVMLAPKAQNEPVYRLIAKNAYMPKYAHHDDAGMDLRSTITVDLEPNSSVTIDTGVTLILPPGMAGLLVSKSGLNVNHDITSTGLIDPGYTGTIRVKLYNHGDEKYHIKAGDKISQIVLLPILRPEIIDACEVPETERGDCGFGSTGR